jgi:hypothetical protein
MEKKIQYKLYTFYDELDILKVIKTGILRWPGHLFRMQETEPCRELTLLKQEDTRRVGGDESVKVDLKNMGVRNCRRLKGILAFRSLVDLSLPRNEMPEEEEEEAIFLVCLFLFSFACHLIYFTIFFLIQYAFNKVYYIFLSYFIKRACMYPIRKIPTYCQSVFCWVT